MTEGLTLDESMIQLLREKSRNDLYFFAKGVLGFDWLVPHIHMPICHLLEDPKNTRLTIVLPRSWLKSTLCSIAYPIWAAVRDPDIRILIVQNSHANACKKLAVIRGKFETCALFRALFPELLPDKTCVWTNDALCIPRKTQSAESTFEAAGTKTKVVSRHYNKIIEDDTVSPDLDDMTEGALLPSKSDVDQAIGWHRQALPLLVNALTDQILIVGTRWFEKDLISWNHENEKSYKRYIRAVRETNGIADEEGDCTYPERFPKSILEELAAALGPYLYSCLYMNKPLRSSDMVFQLEWFEKCYYETPPRDIVCYTTVDLAGDPEESKGDPDWNVVMTTGKDLRSGRVYVLDFFRARCNPGDLIHALFEHVRRFHPVRVGIESIAYQKSLMYWVRERMRADNLYFMVEPITHGKRSKNTRIQGLQPLVADARLMFRRHHRALVSELTAFPLAAYDDLSDALSMQLPMWALTRSKAEDRKTDPSKDIFSLDHALKELSTRAKSRTTGNHAWRNINH